MKTFKQYSNLAAFSMLFMLTLFAAGCGSSDNATIAPDTTAPTIVSTNPGDVATNVYLNRSIIAFSDEALDASTVNETTFTLADGTVAVAGVVSYVNNTLVFNPTADLNASTEYTATLTTGVKDSAGNALASVYAWSFTTGTATDVDAPTVTSTDPTASATDVPLNRSVSALFTEALDPFTVNTTTFTLKNGTTAVPGAVSYKSNTMIFDPASDLTAGINYTATITTGVKDLADKPLAAEKVWSFTTGTTVAKGPKPVELGTAGNYVILAKTAVSATTTAGTAITGNIGVSPAARTYITGFSDILSADGTYSTSSLVTGRIYASNMAVPTPANLTTAVSNMETAYTDAAGRTLPDHTELGAGNVSGMTLAPGLYKWGTGLLITSAGVTISGSATDVWIFQIAGDLTVANSAIVTLEGGALAKNIFWQVAGGTGVTLGTDAKFQGVVLAAKGIVVETRATVDGRLLAQTAVTLDANPVTEPAN